MESIDLSPVDRVKLLLQSKNRSGSKILFVAKNWVLSPDHTEPDFSYFAVVCFPTMEWLQIQTPRDKLLTTILSPDKPVIRVDELFKFCDLLWRGDIVAVEALYLEENIIYQSDEWQELVRHRKSFALTRLLMSHYAGQPRAQLLHKTKTVDWYNVWKWLYEADQLLEGLEPIVLWDKRGNADKQSFLQSLKGPSRGNDPELRARTLAYIQRFEKQLDILKQIEKNIKGPNPSEAHVALGESILVEISDHLRCMPVQAPKEFLNRWMIGLRCKMIS